MNLTGSYVAIAGIVVSVLGHFGFSATIDEVAQVIGALGVIYGVIHQHIANKKLAGV